MAGKFTQAIEIAHERFFAKNPGLLGHSPLELDRIPRSTALFFEMLWADWRLRVERQLSPLALIHERIQSGDASEELQEVFREYQQLSDETKRERLNWLIDEAGDLSFELQLAGFLAVADDPGIGDVWGMLKGILGTGFVPYLISKTGVPEPEAKIATMQAAWEVVEKAVERGDKGENQRAVFRKSVLRRAMLILVPELGLKESDKERRKELEALYETTLEAQPLPDAQDDAHALVQSLRDHDLTPRQLELALTLALEGAPSWAEAGRDLGMSESTALVHAHSIRKKMRSA